MVPIKVSRGGLEGIGAGIQASLSLLSPRRSLLDSYTRVLSKKKRERERTIDSGEDRRTGRGRGDGGGEEVAEDEGRKDKERTKERRLALMHHRGNGMVWGRGPSYLSYFRPP